jgi:Zn/Cd-binding protein ZinT
VGGLPASTERDLGLEDMLREFHRVHEPNEALYYCQGCKILYITSDTHRGVDICRKCAGKRC